MLLALPAVLAVVEAVVIALKFVPHLGCGNLKFAARTTVSLSGPSLVIGRI